MPVSLTYIAVVILTALGVEDADTVVNAALIVASALIALYGRYRAGGVNIFGVRL